jgi:hypothetical protein
MAGPYDLPHCQIPCSECPWRRDMPPGRFPPQRYRDLAHTCYDAAMSIFTCHKSPPHQPRACAGFLIRYATHNLIVRMSRRITDVRSPYELHRSYRDMAILNGVDPQDITLRAVRDD